MKEKQIEEMAKIAKQALDENRGWRCKCDICVANIIDGIYCDESAVINGLYNAGYRKQSEIVRCKDCEYAYMDGDRAYCRNIQTPWYNDYFEVFTKANDFCSYAKMKGGERDCETFEHKQSEGEWITKGDELKNTTCSVCNYWVETPYGKTPYCPHCGAKMKGGEDNE